MKTERVSYNYRRREKMNIFETNSENAILVARLMSRIKPDWWSIDSALEQVTSPDIIGWYMGESEDVPIGFINIKEHATHYYVELNNYGYDDNGEFVTGEGMAILYEKIEQYAASKGLRSVRTTITWTDASFSEQEPTTYAKELLKIANYSAELLASGTTMRRAYPYLLNRGYYPAGLIADCYGEGLHGLILLKHLA